MVAGRAGGAGSVDVGFLDGAFDRGSVEGTRRDDATSNGIVRLTGMTRPAGFVIATRWTGPVHSNAVRAMPEAR